MSSTLPMSWLMLETRSTSNCMYLPMLLVDHIVDRLLCYSFPKNHVRHLWPLSHSLYWQNHFRPSRNRRLLTHAQWWPPPRWVLILDSNQWLQMLPKCRPIASQSIMHHLLCGSTASRQGKNKFFQIFKCSSHCSMNSHCQQGMVFAVNPTANKTFAAFQVCLLCFM